MAKSSAASASFHPAPDMRMVVLHGEDDLLRREHLAALRRVLHQAHGEVEEYAFDAMKPQDCPASQLFDEIRSYSLMQRHKLVVLNLRSDKGGTLPYLARDGGYRDLFERYAESPVDNATLVIRTASGWKPGTLDKLVAKVGAVVKCDHPAPEEARDWLVAQAVKKHAKVDAAAAMALVERMGCDLLALESEMDKLVLLAGGKPVTRTLVEAEIGLHSEEKAWAVQDAMLRGLAAGDPREALEMVHELVDLTDKGDDNLIPLLIAQVSMARNLSTGSRMLAAGMPAGEVGKALKLWGSGQQLFFAAVRVGTPAAFAALFEKALELEARAKGGGLGDPRRAAEMLCVAMASAGKKR